MCFPVKLLSNVLFLGNIGNIVDFYMFFGFKIGNIWKDR